MKIRPKYTHIWLLLIMLFIVLVPKASAQTTPNTPAISFNNFSGTYHLSRDAQNRSLLTTEEVILAHFPSDGSFQGITRAIPQIYQNKNVKVKVLNVLDVAGNPIPFKTSSDKNHNLVITTGDPQITLYGTQTFKINYQTRDIVNLNSTEDELILNVNGRGWDQPFSQVSGVVHISSSFSSSLVSKPSCYIGYLAVTSSECTINSETKPEETLISSKSQSSLKAHQALVIKLKFKKATFSNTQEFWQDKQFLLFCGITAGFVAVIFWYRRRRYHHPTS